MNLEMKEHFLMQGGEYTGVHCLILSCLSVFSKSQ